MQIYGMDPELVSIYNIRNLESVRIWDFESLTSSQRLIVPAILITYDGGKTLNLCAKDKHFNIYVKKVAQVYNDEKNNILEDALSDPFRLHSSIIIDDFTRKILESRELEQINDIYSFYNNKDSFDTSQFFQIDEVRSLIDIVRYHLSKLFTFTDKVVTFNEDEITGFRNNYCLTGQVDGVEKVFPFIFEKTDNNKYDFWIAGIENHNHPIKLNIAFENENFIVSIEIESYGLVSTSKYVITNGVVKEIHDITKNGLTISYKNEDLEEVQTNELQNFADIDESSNLKWFRLPWQAVYGIDTKITDISEVEKIIEIQNMYVSIFNGGFIKKENYSKKYKRNKTVTLDSNDMILDEVRKSVIGVSIDEEQKTFVIETSFDTDNVKDGMLNGVITGEHFYHACHSKTGLNGIIKKKLVPLRKRHIITNSDLVNKHRILKLIKGE